MEKNKYYEFGQQKFGPFLYGFVRWLKNELIRRGFEKVFFFSRDGYMMQKAFDIINDTDIVSQYVYVSRRSLRQPLIHECTDFEDSLKYLSKERYISFGKLLEYYGYDESEKSKVATEAGINLEETMPYDEVAKNALARKLYEDNRESIVGYSREQDELLLEYTEQLNMRGKFAIVDIGWHGNMQRYLELYMKSHGYDVSFEGFYIGILPDVELTTEVHGYIYSPENPKPYKKLLSFFGVSEKLLQGFEGSTAGYTRIEDGLIGPKLMAYEYEGDQQVISAIQSWQSGALDYVRSCMDGVDKTNQISVDASDEQLTKPLIRFGMKPSLKDTNLFSFFYNTDGTKAYYTAQKSLFRYRPKELVHALADSPWKTGFMKSVFKLPLPYYLIYKILKK